MIEWKAYRDRIRMQPYEHPAEALSDEEKNRIADRMIGYLLRERGEIAAFNMPYARKRELIRGYLNERAPNYFDQAYLDEWDRVLWSETLERGIVDIAKFSYKRSVTVWQGDITRLNADAIVNSANHSLLGCFIPGHRCIDNVIHSAGGPQIRSDCAKIIAMQGESEQTGGAKVTIGYNLPSKFVFHTVGPMVDDSVTALEKSELRGCYVSCLDLAAEMGLSSIAFCCISTGVFGFPADEAAALATGTVLNWLLRNGQKLKVIFNVFLDEDRQIYDNIFKFM